MKQIWTYKREGQLLQSFTKGFTINRFRISISRLFNSNNLPNKNKFNMPKTWIMVIPTNNKILIQELIIAM